MVLLCSVVPAQATMMEQLRQLWIHIACKALPMHRHKPPQMDGPEG